MSGLSTGRAGQQADNGQWDAGVPSFGRLVDVNTKIFTFITVLFSFRLIVQNLFDNC